MLTKRVQAAGIAVTVLAVLVLGGSLVFGLGTGGEEEPRTPPLPEAASRRGERVRVEVLNAGGVSGAAREATRILRDRGFDVVYFGNARGFAPDSSQVIDRAGRAELAEEVARALAIPRVRTRPDSTLLLEVTVVLGADWAPEGSALTRR